MEKKKKNQDFFLFFFHPLNATRENSASNEVPRSFNEPKKHIHKKKVCRTTVTVPACF